jgi:hypothetical protein
VPYTGKRQKKLQKNVYLSLLFWAELCIWMVEAGGMGKKRRVLNWPSEAAKIATGEADPSEKCAELARISGNEKQACWRFLKRYGIERPPNQRRKRSRWPEGADIVAERSASPAAICAELMRISGNGEKACWRFLEQHGIRRPGSAKRTTYSDQLFERVLEYSAEHGIQATSLKFHLSTKSISNVLYRREQTGLSRDALTLRDLCMFLRVRPKSVLDWVERGWLAAEKHPRNDGRVVHRFHHDAIKRFCNEYRGLLLKRRWPKERLNFCETFIFAPKHAELIEGRESKRERQALQEQEEREEEQRRLAEARVSEATSKTDRNAVGVSRSNVRKFDDCA